MKKLFILLFLIYLPSFGKDLRTLEIQALWIPKNMTQAEQEFFQFLKDEKGFLVSADPYHWTFRLPQKQALQALTQFPNKGYWQLRSKNSRDLSFQINQTLEQIQQKQKALQDYLQVLASSSFESFVQIESEIIQIQENIENLKSTLNQLQRQADWAEINIQLQNPPQSELYQRPEFKSPFQWIQRKGFAALYKAFYGTQVHLDVK